MDMQRIEPLMIQLCLANECEAAAQMDVKDVEDCIAVYQEKLKAVQCRLCETQRAAQEASNKVALEIARQTDAPINAIREQEWR